MKGGFLPGRAQSTQRRLPALARWRWPRDAPVVALPVSVAGLALFGTAMYAFVSGNPGLPMIAGTLALLAAAVFAEAFPVPIEGVAAGRTSLANIFIVGAAVIYGWPAATIAAYLGMAIVELGHRRRLSRLAFNTGLYGLAAVASGAAAAAVQGHDLGSLLLAAVLGSVSFYAVDITLLSTVISASAKRPFATVLARSIYSTILPFTMMASLTAILVVLWDESAFIAVALTGPLIAVALYERRVHAALERLRELDRLKSEFIAVVSHELRTPIASVYGAAMTLQQRSLDEIRRRSMLSVIFTESARLARLVDQVVWASRLETGHMTIHVEPCEPGELAADVVDAARVDLPGTLTIELRAPATVPRILADPERVRQVLANLVDNAVKFSPDGGSIQVGLETSDGRVRFAVSDEGLGIPADEQARIFEKFHRLDPNLTRGVGGTGLGLYICQQLVEEMHGRIWVDSRQHEGSTFVFELPLA